MMMMMMMIIIIITLVPEIQISSSWIGRTVPYRAPYNAEEPRDRSL